MKGFFSGIHFFPFELWELPRRLPAHQEPLHLLEQNPIWFRPSKSRPEPGVVEFEYCREAFLKALGIPPQGLEMNKNDEGYHFTFRYYPWLRRYTRNIIELHMFFANVIDEEAKWFFRPKGLREFLRLPKRLPAHKEPLRLGPHRRYTDENFNIPKDLAEAFRWALAFNRDLFSGFHDFGIDYPEPKEWIWDKFEMFEPSRVYGVRGHLYIIDEGNDLLPRPWQRRLPVHPELLRLVAHVEES